MTEIFPPPDNRQAGLSETRMTPERIVDKIQFFDLDGVLTDPSTKKVNKEAVKAIGKDLENNRPVIFQTGRGWGWVEKNIMPVLKEGLSDPKLLENTFTSTESGGVTVTYRDGQPIPEVKVGFALPDEFIEESDHITDRYTTLSRKEDKSTMYSVEMHDLPEGTPPDVKEAKLQKFHQERDILANQYRQLVGNFELPDMLVDPTTIALDIRLKDVGKRLGTREAIAWLKDKGVSAKIYEVFGDHPITHLLRCNKIIV